ncbi:hypothetical protein LQ327_26275, partial [Actinomycetospora endophytica]|nr:hypothetical protein [Actinomycetospora endophytica]
MTTATPDTPGHIQHTGSSQPRSTSLTDRDRVLTDSRKACLAPQHQPSAADVDPEPPPVLDVVVPVFNEERGLGPCVQRLHAHLCEAFPYRFRITIADNA